MASESEETVSTAKAAQLLEVGSSTVKRWADDGLLPCIRTAGGHRRFRRDAIERFLAEQQGVEEGSVDVWLDVLLGDEELHRRVARPPEHFRVTSGAGTSWFRPPVV